MWRNNLQDKRSLMIELRGGRMFLSFLQLTIQGDGGRELLGVELVSACAIVSAKPSDQAASGAVMFVRRQGDVTLLVLQGQVCS